MQDDWVSPWWQAVLLPESWDVCGISVPSLTVWHTFALENIANLYMLDIPAHPPTRDDAYSLLTVASLDMKGGRRLMTGPRFMARRLRWIKRKLRKVELDDLDAACTEYVSTCMRTASMWNDGNAGTLAGVPYQFGIVRVLCDEWGMTVEAAWNRPYALARSEAMASAEFHGGGSVMTRGAQEMEDNWTDHPANTDEMSKFEISNN